MPNPVFVPGSNVWGGSNLEAIPYPQAQWVFARTRGSGMSIWYNTAAIRIRHIWDGPCEFNACCPVDSELIALQHPECWQVLFGLFCNPPQQLVGPLQPCTNACADVHAVCPAVQDSHRCSQNTGCGVPGNVQSFAPGIPNLDMQALGFTITGGVFVASVNGGGSGSTIAPLTIDNVTFPGNTGPGANNLQDVFGHQIWIGKWQSPDNPPLLLYVAVVAGAAPPNGPPQAPGWTLVLDGATGGTSGKGLMSVFIYAPNPGSGPCFSSATDGVVQDICKRAGLVAAQIDVSLIETPGNISPTNLVKGFVIERPTPAAEILKTLFRAYFFDGCETSGTMKFVPRGLASALTIPEADLGLVADKAKLLEQFAEEQDLPQRFSVTYNDPLYLYQQGKQDKIRNTRLINTKQQAVINLPMVMDPDWARSVAEKTLYLAWLERQHFQFNLARSLYMLLDPTDVIQFVYQGLTFTMRVVENALGQGFAIELKGVNENTNNYLSTVSGGTPPGIGTPAGGGTQPQNAPPTMMALFDIPLLQDSDANPGGTGKYVALSSVLPSSWPGAQLYVSSDNAAFATDGNPETVAAVFGYAVGVLGNPANPFTWDNVNTLTVRVGSSSFSFAGDTPQNVLNGSNMMIVGQEIIQFQNAVNNGDGTWTLSGLLRGRRGTEWACGFWGDFPSGTNAHKNGEICVLVSAPGVPIGSAGVFRVDDQLSTLNALRYYRGVTLGLDLTTVTSQTLSITGADLKPYAPVQVGGSFDSFSDAIITWQRRSRIAGDGWGEGGDTLPLGEDSEAYDVEIFNGSLLVRTVRVTTPTLVYTKAQMIADFGSVPASFAVNVYQISAQVGRGYKGHGIIPTANGLPEILPNQGGTFYVNGT